MNRDNEQDLESILREFSQGEDGNPDTDETVFPAEETVSIDRSVLDGPESAAPAEGPDEGPADDGDYDSVDELEEEDQDGSLP